MPTRLWKLATFLTAAGLLIPAGLAIAHPHEEAGDHACQGKMKWDDRNGVVSQQIAVGFGEAKTYLTVYVMTEDPKDDSILGKSVWMESNGWDHLQVAGFECKSNAHDEPGYVDHSDMQLI